MSDPATAAPEGRTPFPASRVLPFGLPLVAGMGGHALFNLVDLWIVGGLGPPAIAAVTISGLVNSVSMVIVQGVTEGSVALIARAVGAADLRRAGEVARQSILLSLLLGVLLGVPPWLAARPLAGLFGARGLELEMTTQCLEVMSLGSVTMFVLLQAGAALRALGGGRAPAVLLVGANLLNVPLAIGLVHGKFGLPALGVVGACWGTIAARGVFALVGLRLLAGSGLGLRLRGIGPSWSVLGPLLRLGLPVAGQWFVRLTPVLVVLGITGKIGTGAHAAYGIGSRLDQFVVFACAGWGAAAATAVGQGLGARDPRGAARAALLGAVTMGAAAGLYHALAPRLLTMVGGERGASPEVVALGVGYLRAVVFAYPAMGMALVLSMALAGGGSVKTALALESAVLLGIQVPLALGAAPDGPGGSLLPVWWVIVGTYWLLAASYAGVFAWGRWKRKVL